MSTIEERLTAVEVTTRGLEGKVVEVQRTVAAGDVDAKTMIAALTLFAVLAAAFGVITKML